jgi:S-formylglutathione hydrolase FrmB
MARKNHKIPAGRLVRLEHDSEVLRNNPLGDPSRRSIDVWLPPQYAEPQLTKKRFPVMYDLVGYTGTGQSHTQWKGFEENLPERLARLNHEEQMGACIVVFPDCFTALGGNQYINSAAIGDYADYLTQELIPFIDAEFRTLASREHRACFGKSSGGYGALIHGMQYAKHWGAIASHAGDAHFDFIYRSDWPNTLTQLARFAPKQPSAEQRRLAAEGIDDGRVKSFLDYIWKRAIPNGAEIHCLMNLCMAATYDPDPHVPNGFRIPFTPHTGELIPQRWKRWLAHDPALIVDKHINNLASLNGIYIDCGWRDQYHIHYGARILHKRLSEAGIDHFYEEFDGTHSGIDGRMDISLPWLYQRIAKKE